MINVSVKWEVKTKKQNSNTFQRIGWDMVVFHTITCTVIGSLPTPQIHLHFHWWFHQSCSFCFIPSSSARLLAPPPVGQEHDSFFACHELFRGC